MPDGAPVYVAFDGTVGLVNFQPVIASEEGLTVEIDGEEISVTFDRMNVVVNGEEVGVSETVGGSAASCIISCRR